MAAFVAAAAHAQMHMCKDAQGRKVYSDQPCGKDDTIVNVNPGGGPTVMPGTSMKVEYYDIRGTTWEALMNELRAKGPEGWWGNAGTAIGWKATSRMTPAGCVMEGLRLDADSTMHLPRWANRFEGSAALQSQWDTAFRALEYHERGHVQISLESARQMERELRAIPPQPTCAELEALSKAITQRIVAEHRQRQTLYDAENQHGASQWTPYRN